MIGVALHLLALVPAAVAARATRFGLGLLCRAPQGSEIERLGDECDVLRGERDKARAQLADAQTLAHEAKLEFSAARETCEQLRGELATARQERADLRVAARAVVRSLGSPFGDPPALASPWVDRSYVQAWRALVALVDAPEGAEAPRG